MDQATHEALERLVASGLISMTSRSSRPLYPAPEKSAAPTELSAEERARADAFRTMAGRKLKMARLLGDGELAEEARAALLEAMLFLGQALAVESRLPEPASPEETIAPPLSYAWKGSLPGLRSFIADRSMSWRSAWDLLKTV